jgi:thiosulfate/3-mercaptopyruvate sulfurtransferase
VNDVLIDAAALAELLESDRPPVVLDVRWRLDQPDGRAEFRAGHLPGAVYVDLDSQLAGRGVPADGRHPLPAIADLQEAARTWGVNDGDTVVVYDDLGNLSAARAWWLLRWAGIADVRLLDGALNAWREAAFPLEAGEAQPARGTVRLSAGHLPTLDMDEAGSLPESGLLIDSRAPERYRGDIEPIDPKPGHIPGAVNLPTTGNLDDSGRFLSPAALRERFDVAGVTSGRRLGVYCGSGVTASHNIVAMTLAGFEPALFAGSWSAWSNTGRPVERELPTTPPAGA